MRNGNTRRSRHLTFAEYLALEETSSIKHELVDGEVYAMTGTTIRHNQIAGNAFARLKAAARGGPCRVYMADVKVRAAENVTYYPDVVVLCGLHDPSDVVASTPCAVVEVTSRSTARVDRGEKLTFYRGLATLRTYLIVDQYRKRVTCHARDGAGVWQSSDFEGAGSIDISCSEMRLTLDEIYEDVEMPALGVAEPEVDDRDHEYASD